MDRDKLVGMRITIQPDGHGAAIQDEQTTEPKGSVRYSYTKNGNDLQESDVLNASQHFK